MVRMASVYLKEGSVENAYILYFKFMALFIEKVKLHPEYKTLPNSVKQPINSKLKEVMPVCEKLKEDLLTRYKKEYKQFLIEKEKERMRLVEEAKEKV